MLPIFPPFFFHLPMGRFMKIKNPTLHNVGLWECIYLTRLAYNWNLHINAGKSFYFKSLINIIHFFPLSLLKFYCFIFLNKQKKKKKKKKKKKNEKIAFNHPKLYHWLHCTLWIFRMHVFHAPSTFCTVVILCTIKLSFLLTWMENIVPH